MLSDAYRAHQNEIVHRGDETIGELADCINQQGEAVNTQPRELFDLLFPEA